MCVELQDCNCRAVVTRVYRELREKGLSDPAAFDSAARVFALYHPETTPRGSCYAIAEWLDGIETTAAAPRSG